MKVAMVGSGAAGSVFASYLRLGGADMYLLDPYAEHMEKVARDGMLFAIDPGEYRLITGFKAATRAEELGVMDIVIYLTKATQLENAIKDSLPLYGPDTIAVSLINGLGNDDKLLKYFYRERCLIGSGSIGTRLDGPGACTSFPNEGIVVNFGPLSETEKARKAGLYLEKCFNEGGCGAKYREDIQTMIWWKVIKNCSHSPVCAVLRLSIGDTDADVNGRELFDRVIREGVAVAKARGVDIMDADAFIQHDIDQCKENGPYVNSMTQDVCIKKLQTEVDMLTGALSDYGRELGIPTPTCDVLTLIIKAIQNNYDKQICVGQN